MDPDSENDLTTSPAGTSNRATTSPDQSKCKSESGKIYAVSSLTDPKPCSSKSLDDSSFTESPSSSSEKREMDEILEELSKDESKSEEEQNQRNSSNEKSFNFSSPFGEFQFGNANFPFSSEIPKKSYANSEEYFADLRLWLQQAFFWQSLSASFPYFMMCQQFGQFSPQGSLPMNPASTVTPNSAQPYTFPQFPAPGFQFPRQEQPTVTRTEVIDGVECRIPSFWKRIAAEFIDFLLLFFVKVAATYVAVDFFNFVEMDTFDLFQKDVKLAYKTFIQITQEIVILEMIHRLVVCAFETFWLIGGQNGRLGGSTPGKNIMGLRVISCDSSTALREGDDRVVVKPGGNLGLGTAFLRALTKNFVLALLIPTSFAFIFFPHNRTGYDMICNTIVVEEPIVPHRVHQD